RRPARRPTCKTLIRNGSASAVSKLGGGTPAQRRIQPFACDGNEHDLDSRDDSGHSFFLGTATSVGSIGVSCSDCATQRAGNAAALCAFPNGTLWGEVLWPSI